jgi:PAS domain-containing protein
VNGYFDDSTYRILPTDRSTQWPAQCGGLLIDSCASSAIFLLDNTGRVASWNVGAERIIRYRFAEIIGSHFSRLTITSSGEGGLNDGLKQAESRGD